MSSSLLHLLAVVVHIVCSCSEMCVHNLKFPPNKYISVTLRQLWCLGKRAAEGNNGNKTESKNFSFKGKLCPLITSVFVVLAIT